MSVRECKEEDKVEEIGSVKRWRRWGKCIHTYKVNMYKKEV